MRISDWSSDVCSSDLRRAVACLAAASGAGEGGRLHRHPRPALLGRRARRERAGACPGALRGDLRRLPRQEGGHNRGRLARSEEHTSELQSLMRISYAVFCLKKKQMKNNTNLSNNTTQKIHTVLHTH